MTTANGVFSPLDHQLALVDKHWSENVVKAAVWLSGVVGSYEKAAVVLLRIGQLGLSATSIWRRVEQWGTAWQAVEEVRQAKANALPSVGEATQAQPSERQRLGAALDGAMVNIRQEGWKELKVGCVFTIEQQATVEPNTKETVVQGHAVQTTYVAHLGGPEQFGQLMWAEALCPAPTDRRLVSRHQSFAHRRSTLLPPPASRSHTLVQCQ